MTLTTQQEAQLIQTVLDDPILDTTAAEEALGLTTVQVFEVLERHGVSPSNSDEGKVRGLLKIALARLSKPHPTPAATKPAQKKDTGHTCPDCSKTFPSKQALTFHAMTHRPPTPCGHPGCDYATKHQPSLARHRREHTTTTDAREETTWYEPENEHAHQPSTPSSPTPAPKPTPSPEPSTTSASPSPAHSTPTPGTSPTKAKDETTSQPTSCDEPSSRPASPAPSAPNASPTPEPPASPTSSGPERPQSSASPTTAPDHGMGEWLAAAAASTIPEVRAAAARATEALTLVARGLAIESELRTVREQLAALTRHEATLLAQLTGETA